MGWGMAGKSTRGGVGKGKVCGEGAWAGRQAKVVRQAWQVGNGVCGQ